MNLRPPAPILLVDDAPANLLALEAVLQTLGEPLVRAGSGQEALRRLRDADYAAVLLDVRMPGMDGFETARLIRAQRRSRRTPIIFVTADASDLSVEEAYAMGAVDFLTKPIVPAVLKAKLAFFVELHRSRQELQAAERKAVQDRAFLSAVLEAVEDGIVACGPDGALTLFNRATREFHAMDLEPVGAAKWQHQYDLYAADGVTPLKAEEVPLQRALSGEVVRNVELVIAPPGGKARQLIASGQPLYDEAGHKLGAVVSMHDISAQREAELAREAAIAEQTRREEAEAAAELIRESRERLRESEQRVRLATEAAGLGVWVWEPASDRLAWENERVFQIFGLAVDNDPSQPGLLQERLHELLHPDDLQACRDALLRTATQGERLHFEGRFRRRSDGALRWMELTGVLEPAQGANAARVLGTIGDITDRKRAEEELRRSEERYRTLLESLDEGFCIIEMIWDGAGRPVDYRFVEVNRAFEKHTGMFNAAGRTMREIAPGHEEHWFEIYGRVARTGEPVRFESEAHALGRWFDVYATCMDQGSGRVAVLFTDITERRRSEENLRRLAAELAETDRRKTEFLATLAHELRNPLAPISNGLQLLRVADGDPQAKERARDMMERQLRHLVRLVDDLLDIARISSGKVELKKEPAELGAILASAVESSMPLLDAAGHQLEVRIAEPRLPVIADTTRLAQVVSNLLNNAAKYTPPGGHIALAARREGGEVVVSVADTGIGIVADALPQVFEMFTQVARHRDRSQGGLGIGLALVRRLVELHGGTVTAESPGVGQGSTFTVRLPLPEPATAEPREAPPTAAGADNPPVFRVLVVDDNVDAAESLAALLELDGHQTRVAHDGDDAIAAAGEFRPDIVFLDIGMPGKDGYEVARELRRDPRNRDTMLVALTGWGAQDDRARSKNAGFDHHLTKPAELPAVEALLARMAQRRQETSAA